MLTCDDMILECYWFGKKYDDCTDLFEVRYTDDGYCCTFNTLPMSEQLLVFYNFNYFIHLSYLLLI